MVYGRAGCEGAKFVSQALVSTCEYGVEAEHSMVAWGLLLGVRRLVARGRASKKEVAG